MPVRDDLTYRYPRTLQQAFGDHARLDVVRRGWWRRAFSAVVNFCVHFYENLS